MTNARLQLGEGWKVIILKVLKDLKITGDCCVCMCTGTSSYGGGTAFTLKKNLQRQSFTAAGLIVSEYLQTNPKTTVNCHVCCYSTSMLQPCLLPENLIFIHVLLQAALFQRHVSRLQVKGQSGGHVPNQAAETTGIRFHTVPHHWCCSLTKVTVTVCNETANQNEPKMGTRKRNWTRCVFMALDIDRK